MIVPELNNEDFLTADDIAEALSEQFEAFVEPLWDEDGMTREPNEDDSSGVPEGARIYTPIACKMIKAERDRLHAIGQKYFPNEDTPIESSYYQEY